MGDSREAGTPRMSPQWAMVMGRFDDMARGLSRLEQRLDESDRETRSEMNELRDQMMRTRDEVAHLRTEGTPAIIESIEAMAERVQTLEDTRKGDVREVVREDMPAALAEGARKAPGEAWARLGWPSKTGAVVGGLTVIGAMIGGVVEGLPKLAALIWRVVVALGRPTP